jgi:uncharacterized protein (DUF1501 family)
MIISNLNRRQFLGGTCSMAAWGATVPAFLQQTGSALAAEPTPGSSDQRTLVLIQLAGGNDGLNTVVPYRDDVYYRSRPKLAIDAQSVLPLDDHCGLHPQMDAMKRLWDDGLLTLVQGVGYPNPDLSHFRSTEIWETGSAADQSLSSGWIGRYFDDHCRDIPSPMLGLQLGDRTAQTFSSDRPRCVTFSNPDLFRFSGGPRRLDDWSRVHQVEPGTAGPLNFLQRTGNDVLGVSRRLAEAVADGKNTADYLPFQFSQSLKLVAKLIAAEVPTRVFYVSLGGFDHHANQSNSHAMLLQELSEGLTSFVNDLQGLGCLDRTLVMTFSEFGRRVAENKSLGTDHGTANAMFMAGGNLRPGFHGQRPDLQKLDSNGDLSHHVDFRAIYSSVLGDWLGADAATVLGESIPPLPGLTV